MAFSCRRKSEKKIEWEAGIWEYILSCLFDNPSDIHRFGTCTTLIYMYIDIICMCLCGVSWFQLTQYRLISIKSVMHLFEAEVNMDLYCILRYFSPKITFHNAQYFSLIRYLASHFIWHWFAHEENKKKEMHLMHKKFHSRQKKIELR